MNAPIPNAARILGQTGVLRADDGGRRRIGRCGGPTDVSYPLLRTPSICPRRILSRKVNGFHL